MGEANPQSTELERLAGNPIATVPKDGTLIIVGDPDVGEFPMRWGHIQKNEIFAPGVVGMWVLDGGGMTWTDSDGLGPTYWRPYPIIGEQK